jgi:hypothetical protein
VHPTAKLHFDCTKLRYHPQFSRDTPDNESTILALPTKMRKAQERECFRFPFTTPFPVAGGEPPKLDQSRLLCI